MGLILVTETALAASAIPLPGTDVGNDWLWIDSAVVGSQADDQIGGAVTVERMVVDSKAMRKVNNNQALVLVLQLTACEGSAVSVTRIRPMFTRPIPPGVELESVVVVSLPLIRVMVGVGKFSRMAVRS